MRGIKVLDFSMGVAGPHVGALCAQHGADVIKIESLEGDWARVLGEQYGDFSAASVVYNRGKRSLAIDLKDPEAQLVIRQMAAQADVIVEAFRPGVMHKFGLDYESLRRVRPGLIYLSINGFGSHGPLADAPATDAVLQAFTGMMCTNKGSDEVPQRIDLVVIDVVTGLYGFQALAGALLERERLGGEGRHIECSLLASGVALQAAKILESHIEPGERAMYVPLGVFPTADGYISLSVRRDEHFAALSTVLDRSDWVSGGPYSTAEQRVARRLELIPLLNDELRRFSTSELSSRLTEANVLHAKVNEYADLLVHEQVKAVKTFDWQQHESFDKPLPLARIPGAQASAVAVQAPRIGEHSVQVLKEWEISERQIEKMLESGAIRGVPGRPPGAVPR